MKLTMIKAMGSLKVGDTHYTESDEQGQYLIEKGFAEENTEADPEPVETERVLYKDEKDGGWKTKEVPLEKGKKPAKAIVVVKEPAIKPTKDEVKEDEKDGGENQDNTISTTDSVATDTPILTDTVAPIVAENVKEVTKAKTTKTTKVKK